MTKKIEFDNSTGDYYLDLGQELCAHLGWHEGDTLEWTDNGDNTWSLAKKEKIMEPTKISLDFSQVKHLYDVMTKNDLKNITLVISNSSGIGQSIKLEYSKAEDITNYKEW